MLRPSRLPGGFLTLPNGVTLAGPRLVIDGRPVEDWKFASQTKTAMQFASASRSDVTLRVEHQTDGNDVVRFRYVAEFSGKITHPEGKEDLRYFRLGEVPEALREVSLSHFDPVAHSYLPYEDALSDYEMYEGRRLAGPILVAEGQEVVEDDLVSRALLVAYEHGHDHPDAYVEFIHLGLKAKRTEEDPDRRSIECRAVRANTLDGQEGPLESIWFTLVTAEDAEGAFEAFRDHLFRNGPEESRKPYVFYNTWNHQERLKYYEGRPYLSEMNLERMLAEIDVAHRLGIEVFVIDTGWYGKTGDWEVSQDRFPDGLRQVRAKLEEYGMRFGLWFNPIVAAKSSKVYTEHPEWVMSRSGEPDFWGPVWETVESYGMCVCSGYAEAFAETLVRLHRELGVTYFKWDAIGQLGCDSDQHDHGGPEHPIEVRRQRYGFESGRALTRIVERLLAEVPEAIVDFDVTERGRYFGLDFLRVGKYFLVNNGPYFHDFDIPKAHRREPETINVFFQPGPARSRVCRSGARFDPYVPSGLYLTHYLPDGPRLSQWNALASLVLGGNGIWGDLVSLSAEDVAFWSEQLEHYRAVRDSAARAYPIRVGFPGSSPEIVEKLDADSGEGLVSFFATAPGRYVHVTSTEVPEDAEIVNASATEWLPSGHLKIEVELARDDARVVFIKP